MVLPSRTNSFRLPSLQALNLLFKQVACSLVFDVFCGFWRSNMGSMVAAFRATDSSVDAEANAE